MEVHWTFGVLTETGKVLFQRREAQCPNRALLMRVLDGPFAGPQWGIVSAVPFFTGSARRRGQNKIGVYFERGHL